MRITINAARVELSTHRECERERSTVAGKDPAYEGYPLKPVNGDSTGAKSNIKLII